MANNVLGTKITDLEEAQSAGLTDEALLIVEPETPPTKKSKLSTFFAWVKGKLAAWILSSYDEVMAATEAGYLVDALAVKDGFAQINTKFGKLGTYDKLLSYSGTEQTNYTVSDMSKYRYLYVAEQYADGVSVYRSVFIPVELFRSSCNTGYNSWATTDRFQLRWVSKTQLQAARVSGTTGRALSVYGVY